MLRTWKVTVTGNYMLPRVGMFTTSVPTEHAGRLDAERQAVQAARLAGLDTLYSTAYATLLQVEEG